MTALLRWNRRSLPSLGLAALVCAARPDAAPLQEWPRFRGPDGAGQSDAAGIPTVFGPDDYDWRTALPGSGNSSPVVWGDAVFVTSVEEDVGQRSLIALDTADGAVRWRWVTPFESHDEHAMNNFASSSPAVDAERVYVVWSSGYALTAVALDHQGQVVWERDLGPFGSRWASAGSPVLVDGVLVVAKDDDGDDSFLAGLDPATGRTLWRRDRGAGKTAYSTPTVYRPRDGTARILVSSTAHGLSCLDPRSGELYWEVADLFTERCVSSPVVAGDLVLATAGTGGGGKECVALSLASEPPEARYRLRRSLPYVPTPVVAGGLLFLWSDDGILTCVRPASGEELWRERLDARFFGSPIRIGERLYAMSAEGELFVVAAADAFELLHRLDLGEPSFATPAVSGGVLYLRTAGHLISVGAPLGG